jgi:hypothetical protein
MGGIPAPPGSVVFERRSGVGQNASVCFSALSIHEMDGSGASAPKRYIFFSSSS